ncbi:MAG: ABC transporter transmembrane domain-containing protein, partial [Candidatus Berkelbacteria bacterium]|nr:ABC transporter transmembrane domain-containing protein [Candidatus Berkelbacteria bacterium]
MSEKETSTNIAKPAVPRNIGGRGPMHGGIGAVEKPKDFARTMKNLIKYMRPFWISTIIVLIFAIGSTIFAILSPKILGRATNQVVSDYINIKAYDQITTSLPAGTKIPTGTTGAQFIAKMPAQIVSKIPANITDQIKNLDLSYRPSINFGKIKDIARLLIILYAFSAILSFLQGWIITGVSQKITYRFRRDISEKINRLPLRYFDRRTFGEVLSRVTNDVDTISQTLNQGLSQIVTSVTLIIGILIMMLTISWLLTLVSLVLLPVSLFLTSF